MSEMDARLAMQMYEFASDEAVQDAIHAQVIDLPTLYAALPQEHGFWLPPEGGWIMVKREPHTAIPSPPFASIWRARTVYYGHTFFGLPLLGNKARKKKFSWPLLRARIQTPAGELTLLPDEFTVVQKMEEWTGQVGDGVTLHLLGSPGVSADDLDQKVFYLQSRGLRRWEALSLLLPEVEDPGFAWLSIDGVSDVAGYEAALAECEAVA